MQTFLPFDSFVESARVLDYRRLGKQRVEVKQILNALDGNSKGWQNHPATLMWRGHEAALAQYGVAICEEWIRRGYRDSLLPFFTDYVVTNPNVTLPRWFGDEAFHDSHKSNLLRKDATYYAEYFTDVSDDLPYVWPVSKEEVNA